MQAAFLRFSHEFLSSPAGISERNAHKWIACFLVNSSSSNILFAHFIKLSSCLLQAADSSFAYLSAGFSSRSTCCRSKRIALSERNFLRRTSSFFYLSSRFFLFLSVPISFLLDLRCSSLCLIRLASYCSSADLVDLGLPRFLGGGCVPSTWGCSFTSSIQLNN
jgi:hypothetical protein